MSKVVELDIRIFEGREKLRDWWVRVMERESFAKIMAREFFSNEMRAI
jgi:hypothetical protein